MGISVDTVASFLRRVAGRYAKAGLVDLTSAELAAQAVRDGHVELGDSGDRDR